MHKNIKQEQRPPLDPSTYCSYFSCTYKEYKGTNPLHHSRLESLTVTLNTSLSVLLYPKDKNTRMKLDKNQGILVSSVSLLVCPLKIQKIYFPLLLRI